MRDCKWCFELVPEDETLFWPGKNQSCRACAMHQVESHYVLSEKYSSSRQKWEKVRSSSTVYTEKKRDVEDKIC